jgi:hypothetical protein
VLKVPARCFQASSNAVDELESSSAQSERESNKQTYLITVESENTRNDEFALFVSSQTECIEHELTGKGSA